MNSVVFMRRALGLAIRACGKQSPNPSVGAVLFDEDGQILAEACHEQAGEGHAEVLAIDRFLREFGNLNRKISLAVTLEPCAHFGKTPPCVEKILRFPQIKNIYIGCLDPNPLVSGRGMAFLKAAGLSVEISPLEEEAMALVRGFNKWITRKEPYLILKRAWNLNQNMIPPEGQKTFTEPSSLRLSHQLRKSSQAIVTGSGTVLKDWPEFTVRHVDDFLDFSRKLIVLDRRKRVPHQWWAEREKNFEILKDQSDLSFAEICKNLGQKGVTTALCEAGPQLSDYLIKNHSIDEVWDFYQKENASDLVTVRSQYREEVLKDIFNVYWNY